MSALLTPPVGPGDHVKGPRSAVTTLVELGDYECPSCGGAEPTVKAVEARLGDRLCFVFRNFPLLELHPHALMAAEAAEAAGAQDRFWEMHDLLFRHQDALEPADLVGYAALAGLDLERFIDDLRSGRHRTKIRADLRSGELSGVHGTPTFFINGRRYDGAFDFDSLWEAITGADGTELLR